MTEPDLPADEPETDVTGNEQASDDEAGHAPAAPVAPVSPPADAAAPAGRRTRSATGWLVAVVVLAGLLVGSIVVARQQHERATDARRIESDRQAAALAASAFVESLLTYEFAALEDQRRSVAALSTQRFQDEFASAFTDDLADAIVAEEASSTATVRDVFSTVDDGNRVRAVVVADSEVVSGLGARARLESYLEVTLVRVDGAWLVDELRSLGSRDLDRSDR